MKEQESVKQAERMSIADIMIYCNLKRCWVHRAIKQGKLIGKLYPFNNGKSERFECKVADVDKWRDETQTRKSQTFKFSGTSKEQESIAEWLETHPDADISLMRKSIEARKI